jgi:2,3-diaminopropionate biosynthesis protein SbnA
MRHTTNGLAVPRWNRHSGEHELASDDLIGVGVLGAVGQTPLVRLVRLPVPRGRLYAKLEFLNPGGSAKDRPAAAMLLSALEQGTITKNTVVVESSSGNMGIALAQACAYFGLRFICVVDVKTPSMTLQVIRALGAEVVVVGKPDPSTGELLDARLQRVQELLRTVPMAWWPHQYQNEQNPHSHRNGTAPELNRALGASPDYVYCAASTCGTLGGLMSYFNSIGSSTKVCAVDVMGSAIFGQRRGERLIPGLGSSMAPTHVDPNQVSEVVHVNSAECVAGCRLLATREAILAGGSSGAVVMAALKRSQHWTDDTVAVLVLHDRGERYLDTLFDDDWVRSKLGSMTEVEELLQSYSQYKASSEGFAELSP